MRAVVQRVKYAKVIVENKTVAEIGKGILVLLGIAQEDTEKDMDYIISKILGLRIFEDTQGKMNLSVEDIKGDILVVSQFTLLGDVRKGKRPSFDKAMKPKEAEAFFQKFVEKLRNSTTLKVETGIFGAMMDIEFINYGPVTILLDSNKLF